MVSILERTIIYDREMDSTNTRAKALAREGAKEGTLVITDVQTQGRGRLGRVWQAPEGTNILMSLILKPNVPIAECSQLSIVSALALCDVLKEQTGLEVSIKWPNDLVIHGKKVCGILMELCHDQEGHYSVILGVGINVNVTSFPDDLPYATSLYLESGRKYDRESIIRQFLKHFEVDYKKFQETKNILFLKKRYEKNCITLYKTVKLIKGNEEKMAQAIGITDHGKLSVRYLDGTIENIGYGEVSVRGLYDYV